MRSNYPIKALSDLQKVRCRECGEPLVNLGEIGNESDNRTILIRKSVAEKLQKIQRRLRDEGRGMQLVVREGYRPFADQERYFIKLLLHQHQENPDLNFEELIEKAHRFVALPSVAGHPTGGAVDVTLAQNGSELDMGGKIGDFNQPELIPTYSPLAAPHQTQRRKLLHDLMIAEEFAPYYGEWWHFSYGDREWAAFWGRAEALYCPVF